MIMYIRCRYFVLNSTPFRQFLIEEFSYDQQNSVLDDPVSEAVCIVADTDTW